MTTSSVSLQNLLPEVRSVASLPEHYNPGHCLAVYHGLMEDEELQLPAAMVGEIAANRGSQGCTLIKGIPAKPPSGSILVAGWDELTRQHPQLVEGLPPPEAFQYHLQIGRHVLLTGCDRASILNGAQTFIQVLAACSERLIPGMLITDGPDIPLRGLVYDGSTHSLALQPLMQLVGLLSSFKINRLHLILNPVILKGDGETLTAEEAQNLHDVSREYGVELIPWIDLASVTGDQPKAIQERVDICHALCDVFQSKAIGIAPYFDPAASSQPAYQQAMGQTFSELCQSPHCPGSIYVNAPLLVAMDEQLDNAMKNRLVATICQNADAYESFHQATDNGLRTALFVPSLSQGFASAPTEQVAKESDMAIALARGEEAQEFGYWAGHMEQGHIWQENLIDAITSLSRAWGGQDNTSATRMRFARIVYGQAAQAVLDAQAALSNIFPAALTDPEGDGLRATAFGAMPSPADWKTLRGLDRAHIEEALSHANALIRSARSTLERNSETIEHIDFGANCLQFLLTLIGALEEAREHYEAAKQGRSGSLQQMQQSLDLLLTALPPFANRIETLWQQTGVMKKQLQQIRELAQQLTAAKETVSLLTHSQDLPSAESLGLPPL